MKNKIEQFDKKMKIRLLFLISLLLIGLRSLASETELKDYKFDLMDDIFNLDLEQLKDMKLSTASKSLQSLNQAPSRIIVVTKEQIEQRGYRGLDDLLNDLPAVQILRYADSGVVNQIGIRGVMGNTYFKILQDGIEIDQTDGEFMSVSMQYPLIGVERVEVLYGAASVIYGADAMSGVINIVSSLKPEGQAGVWVGENGYKYLYANSSSKLFGGLFSIKAHYHTDQNYKFDKEYPELYTPMDKDKPAPQYAQNYKYKPHETKSADIRYVKDGFEAGMKYDYSSESTLISMSKDNVGRNRNIFDENANVNSQKINTYLRYKANIFWDIQSTTTLSYSQTEILDDSYYRNRYTGCKGGDYDCMEGYQRSKSQKYSLEETLNKELGNHDITFGAGIDFYDVTPLGYQGSSSSGKKYYMIQKGKSTNAYASNVEAPNYHEKWRNIALYLQDQIVLDENWQLSLALRYDRNSNYDTTPTPRVALINSNNLFTQKLIYSQAFLAPSSNAKYKTYGSSDGTYKDGKLHFASARVPNEDLKPEKSKTYEYNLFIPLSSNDEITLSTYYTNIKDIILLEEELPAGVYDKIYIDNPFSAQNAANANIYGGDISYTGHSYFSGYDIAYWLNYSYIQGKVDYEKFDYDLSYFASHIFKAGGTFRYKKFTFSPSIRWLSPIKVEPYDDVLDKRVNGYFIANLYASYNFTKDQKVALRVDNLFDKHYYGVRYNSSERYLSPQDTRMISIAYTINF